MTAAKVKKFLNFNLKSLEDNFVDKEIIYL
jgi:hypothetical protein